MIKLRYPLLPHQKKAVDKLNGLRVGALYMEMGTGKTRTMLELIKNKGNKIDKVIWFCPCSAKANIKAELEKQLISGHNMFLIVGIESISSSVRLNSFLKQFVKDHRCLIVMDESSKIKNHEAKRTDRLISLGEECRYRYILNGTPISRDERDLFSQWYFLDWRILGYKSVWSFSNNHVKFHEEYHNKVVGTMNTEYLARKIAPYTYKVSLDECVELPGKVHTRYYFDLTEDQRHLYSSYGRLLLNEVNEWKPTTIYKLFNTLQAITAGYILDGDKYIEKKAFLSGLNNPRMVALLDIIENLEGKTIIYCEFRDEIEAILKLLKSRYGEDSAVEFYGGTSLKTRNKNIEKFRGLARFLVANKDCAGFSLNLQFCNQVIYYNNDWDYGTRMQSEDRIYRIGQEHKCHYIDIIANDTLEEYISDCLDRKEGLAERFVEEVGNSNDKAELIIKVKKKRVMVDEVVGIEGDLCENI